MLRAKGLLFSPPKYDYLPNTSNNDDTLQSLVQSCSCGQKKSIKIPNENQKEIKKKTRVKWTDDLHEKFIDCVNRLGGAKKATPKGILKLMNSDGLTICHIKSHLQKYRVDGVMLGATEGNVKQLDSESGVQIVEAIRLQMDVQRRLYEQLESQKELQMRIEEQAKQLQTMIKSQQKTK